ncbi:putative bifunctional diguanylate cyclase/phosphodiesterase [Idiomarina xiamenensis]|uniref:Putative diguanylate phosphodiesterase n=1 Tax=Idiomarina xiamenensis 10-D-4 TaxID=740709 RepID=K2LCJ4_9GAMM|nr:bifunctional diguanylate cyclase/phosphodiesterase [Idiomarina xiamenensis]EKE87605.1 putative diguanylate phosphodiesterase [Idiomarina xiamenensis 10-D-4]
MPLSSARQMALLLAILYAILGGLWITFSDAAVNQWFDDATLRQQIQTYKGWAYVLFTATLLFFLSYSALKREKQLSEDDSLTNLHKHESYVVLLQQLLDNTQQQRQAAVLYYVDINQFRQLNSRYGFNRSDQLLVGFSELLRKNFDARTLLARLGADQFAIAYQIEETHHRQVVDRANHIQRYLTLAADAEGIQASAAIGVAIYPNDAERAEHLRDAAATALSEAKQAGIGKIRFYNAEIAAQQNQHLALVEALKQAIQQQQLSLVYQPQYHLASGEICGCEVLVRWQHPQLGAVSPAQFIPLAEQHHLIEPLSNLVLKQASLELDQAGLLNGRLQQVSINISASEFHTDLIPRLTRDVAWLQRLRPFLQIEITETAALEDLHTSAEVIKTLAAVGIRFSIDDFGTGYSSLSLLNDLPIDEIKIDKSFIDHIVDSPRSHAIVETVIKLSQAFQLNSVAEGVEQAAQAAVLKQLNCHSAQGFYFSKPLPIDDLQQLLQQ